MTNELHGFPRWPDHFFSSESSWTPETQPNDVKAWFCWVSDIQLETLEKSDLSAETVKATYG